MSNEAPEREMEFIISRRAQFSVGSGRWREARARADESLRGPADVADRYFRGRDGRAGGEGRDE